MQYVYKPISHMFNTTQYSIIQNTRLWQILKAFQQHFPIEATVYNHNLIEYMTLVVSLRVNLIEFSMLNINKPIQI